MSEPMDTEVVVVGAGLAGLSCAFELAEAGREVLVLEARPYVGGRTASWLDEGMPVESGLHRWLGFYRALPALLQRAGLDLAEVLCWEDEVEIRTPDGGPRGLFPLTVRRPDRTLAGLLGNNRFLSPLDKASLLPFFVAGLRDYFRRPDALDRWSTLDYAVEHGVRQRAIDRLLVPLTAGLFFVPIERYSALAFFGLFGPALPGLWRTRVGAFLGGMTEVMTAPLAAAIAKRGGQVRTTAEVHDLVVTDGAVSGVRLSGEEIRTRHVVLATALAPAQQLVRPHFGNHGWFGPMLHLPAMPAATVQFELEGPVTDVDRTTFAPGTTTITFAEQSRTTFRHARGRLSVIVSPPEPFLDMNPEEAIERVISDLARVGIDIRGKVVAARVVNRRDDFYSLEPGNHALRPSQETPISGLTLAGDYTRQRWLATMEGAVTSGRLAAEAVLRRSSD